MLEEIIFAGFGGQGVLSLGQIISYAGMLEGREICWMPSYGPEMRGGTASCVVSVSTEPVSSPILSKYDSGLILNLPSFDKFESRIKAGGTLFYDSTNIPRESSRKDLTIYAIPASQEANKMGNIRVMGMILLGAYLHKKNTVQMSSVISAMKKVLPPKVHELNKQALEIGASFIK